MSSIKKVTESSLEVEKASNHYTVHFRNMFHKEKVNNLTKQYLSAFNNPISLPFKKLAPLYGTNFINGSSEVNNLWTRDFAKDPTVREKSYYRKIKRYLPNAPIDNQEIELSPLCEDGKISELDSMMNPKQLFNVWEGPHANCPYLWNTIWKNFIMTILMH